MVTVFLERQAVYTQENTNKGVAMLEAGEGCPEDSEEGVQHGLDGRDWDHR